MSTMPDMLSLWRRHSRTCPHRKRGRAYTKCKCVIWADGELDGKRFRRSTGVRDWQRALRKLAAWESPDAPVLKTVDEAIDGFLTHCRELASSTQRKYRNVMNQLRAYCESQAVNTMIELTVETLDGFRASRDIGRITAVKELQTLRQFCAFCVERRWLAENLAKRIRPPKNVKPEPIEPYTQEEMGAMLAACGEFGRTTYERLRARVMLLLLRYTGLRISDVATLERRRVRDGHVLLHTQKTGGLVLLPIPVELLDALGRLPVPRGASPGCPCFFWNGVTSRRAVVGIAERTLSAVFKKSGVHRAKAHRFRHTLATDILVKGGTEQDVADVLGISPAIVRKHYAKWTPQRQERILNLMKSVHNLAQNWHTHEKSDVIQ